MPAAERLNSREQSLKSIAPAFGPADDGAPPDVLDAPDVPGAPGPSDVPRP
jgi:hypothetical protein